MCGCGCVSYLPTYPCTLHSLTLRHFGCAENAFLCDARASMPISRARSWPPPAGPSSFDCAPPITVHASTRAQPSAILAPLNVRDRYAGPAHVRRVVREGGRGLWCRLLNCIWLIRSLSLRPTRAMMNPLGVSSSHPGRTYTGTSIC